MNVWIFGLLNPYTKDPIRDVVSGGLGRWLHVRSEVPGIEDGSCRDGLMTPPQKYLVDVFTSIWLMTHRVQTSARVRLGPQRGVCHRMSDSPSGRSGS